MDMSLRDIIEILVIAVTLIGFFYKIKFQLDANNEHLDRIDTDISSLREDIKILKKK